MTGTLQPLADGNSKSGAGQTPKRWRTAWIRVERLLLVAGLALLAVYGVARVESALAARAALKEFATLDSGGIASSESGKKRLLRWWMRIPVKSISRAGIRVECRLTRSAFRISRVLR